MPTCPIFTRRRLTLIALLVLLLSACTTLAPAPPVPTLALGEPAITTASQTPTQKPTSTPTEAPTGSPTFTLTSEPTSTLTPSPSPTYAVPRDEVLELSNCRYGPGAMYLYNMP